MKNIQVILSKTDEELARCLRIRQIVFIEEKGVPQELETDEFDTLNKSDHFLVLCDGNSVGTHRCRREAEATIKLQRFCIQKEFRGGGLGAYVLEYIENYYKQLHYQKIELDAKYEVKGFYEKCGYRVCSDSFMEAGIKHIAMEKLLYSQ